jgi:phospholipase/carboxylesterase
MLTESGAVVDRKITPSGHELSQADVSLARDWLVKTAMAPTT